MIPSRKVVTDEFNAIFVGGIGTNGFVKEMWARVRIFSNGDSEYKPMGSLLGRFRSCIHDLGNVKKYPFVMKDVYNGNVCRPFRVYYHSVKLEPYHENKLWSSLIITNNNLEQHNMQLKNKLASVKKRLHDLDFEDRRKKQEIEDAKHYKTVRSNLLYNEQIGLGVR